MPDTALSAGETLSAVGQSATLGVSGFGGIAFQIQGTFDGTLTFEASVGSEWQEMRVTASDSSSPVTSTTDPGIYIGSAVGFTAVRARMTVRNSGAAYVLIRADLASPGGAGGGGGAGSDVNLIEVGGDPIQLGQTTMANSFPVTIASDQSAIPVTVTGGGGGGTASDFGDPFPSSGTAAGIADPDGTMQPLSAETFDYHTGAGTSPQTALGIAIPSSSGTLPVLGGHGTATQALRVELPTDGTGVIATVGTVTTVSTVTSATVVQATAANLNATVVGTGTFAVQVSSALPSGNNNIGDVDVASLPATPAGTNLIGKVSSSGETSTVYNGTTALTPKFAVIAASSSGDNTLVAGVSLKKLRVLNYVLVANGTVNAKFQSSSAGDITGLLYLVANTGASSGYAVTGHFETAAGEDLQLNLSGATAVGGHLSYVEV